MAEEHSGVTRKTSLLTMTSETGTVSKRGTDSGGKRGKQTAGFVDRWTDV
jgi:hypothetical protein